MRRIARSAPFALIAGFTRSARVAALGVLLCVGATSAAGCGSSPGGAVAGSSGTLKVAEKALGIAFDDIPAQVAVAAPMSLTASDGTGLKLVALEGRAVIEDPLAFTELHLTFENPDDRVLEGTFSIVLPQGAAVSRFAMKNAAGFMEGEVVEKKQARAAYEDFLHRKQDPALLEQAAGNEFSARVFPIPARGRKELIVSYSQELSKRAPYVLPLKGLPEIERVDVQAFVPSKAAPILALAKQQVKPEGDFRVEAGLLGERAGVRNGNLVLARVTPVVGSRPEVVAGAVILVDTSASRALGMAEQSRVVAKLCANLARSAGAKAPVTIAAFDQSVEAVFEGMVGEVTDEVTGRFRQRLALGASNVEAALAWAGRAARERALGRVILVGDGVPTAGETSGEKLRASVQALRFQGVERLDAVALGGIRDDALLRSLVNAGLPRGGVVLDAATMGEEETWRRLNEATRSRIEVKVEGAAFTFPSVIDGVQAGDEVLVYANVPEDKPVRISVGGAAAVEPALVKVERPLLERAWVGAKIKSLVERERVDGESAALSREIVGLSTQYRVLSPKTSLLVLETDWDYQRFGIDRRALADILVADGGRIALMKRKLPDPPRVAPTATAVATAAVPAKKPPTLPTPVKTKPKVAATSSGFGAGGGSLGAGRSVAGGAAPPRAAAPEPRRVLDAPAEKEGAKSDEGVGASRGAAPVASAAPVMRPEPAPVLPSPPPPPPSPVTSPATSPPPGSMAAGAPAQPAASASPVTAPTATVAQAPADARPRLIVVPDARVRRADTGAELSADEARALARESSDVAVAPRVEPYTGPFKTVMDLVERGQGIDAIKTAFEWRKTAPGDVMALVALGEAFEAAGEPERAARAYGSLIDLFPGRADLRRFAGERLERLTLEAAVDLAADTYAKAADERPDHPASHRLLAYALLRQGRYERAFEAIVRGVRQSYPSGRFAGVTRILREDLGLVGAVWIKADPKRADEIRARIVSEGGVLEDEPSVRFVLNWETDANDVDFHIHDAGGGHAYYSQPTLQSGGNLYADVTTGYGPECFTIRRPPAERSGPYRLQAHYYSRGPMGYGMGKLQIIDHDGHGGLTLEERPFVVMADRAFVDLGTVKR